MVIKMTSSIVKRAYSFAKFTLQVLDFYKSSTAQDTSMKVDAIFLLPSRVWIKDFCAGAH